MDNEIDIGLLLSDLQSNDRQLRWQALNRVRDNQIEDTAVFTALNFIGRMDEDESFRGLARAISAELGRPIPSTAPPPPSKNTTDPAIAAMQTQLDVIQQRVGCLYNYLIFSIAIGVLAFLISFFAGLF